jgi:adenine-specific DNA-methyltransferase
MERRRRLPLRLAPSLLEKDVYGREIISKAYNGAMLAEALCKLEGFTYAPSDSIWWQHGRSSERDYIYVTTQTLTTAQLQELSEEVGPERTLLVLCYAFRAKADAFPNLTVRKIPNHVRNRCEWGRDDYSLNVRDLPEATPSDDAAPAAPDERASGAQGRRAGSAGPGLFDGDATDG